MTTIEANKTSKDVFYTVIDGSKCEDYIKLKNRNNKEKIDLTDEGVVLKEKLANNLKVKNGDNITIKENDKEKKVKVIGIAGCTMLVYTGIALNDTINNIAERQFGDVRAYKMEINLTSGVTQNEVYDIQKYIEQQDKITRSNTCKTANDNNRSK